MSLLALLLPIAQAGFVADYSYPCSGTNATLDGVAGWEIGYSANPWPEGGGWCSSTVDVEGGTWGTDSAISDFAVQTGESWNDVRVQTEARLTGDDDALGLVFRYTDPGNFYVVYATRADAPDTGAGGNVDSKPGAYLYSVVNGFATELGASGQTQPQTNVIYTLTVTAVGSSIEVLWDGVPVISATNADHPTGSAGIYAYACPYIQHRNFTVERHDLDDDGVADDFDLCPDIADPAQGDLDGDGLGDLCDPDADGDGVSSISDCDDLDPQRFPGASELCGNGIDDDCSGFEDDYAIDADPWYQDADQDGWGDDNSDYALSCDPPPDHVDRGGDCDDGDPTVNPDATEIPGNLTDEDCDGFADSPPTGTSTGETGTGTGGATGTGTGTGGAATGTSTGTGPDDANGRDWEPDPKEPDRASPKAVGCGCATSAPGGTWLGLLALVLVRRRR